MKLDGLSDTSSSNPRGDNSAIPASNDSDLNQSRDHLVESGALMMPDAHRGASTGLENTPSEVTVEVQGMKVNWSKSPSPTKKNSSVKFPAEPYQNVQQHGENNNLHSTNLPDFLNANRLNKNAHYGNNMSRRNLAEAVHISKEDSGSRLQHCADTSASESTSSILTTTSSFFTESDSTIGDSVSLPTLASSSVSHVETDDTDCGLHASDLTPSESDSYSTENRLSDEPQNFALQTKDSLCLARNQNQMKIGQTYFNTSSMEMESKGSSYGDFQVPSLGGAVSFLPASRSEVMRHPPEKRSPTYKKYRLQEKKSAPLFSTPLQVALSGNSKDRKDEDLAQMKVVDLRKTLTKMSLLEDDSHSVSTRSARMSSATGFSDASFTTSVSSAGFMSSSSTFSGKSGSSLCEESTSGSSGFQSISSSSSNTGSEISTGTGSTGSLNTWTSTGSGDKTCRRRNVTSTSTSQTSWMTLLDSSTTESDLTSASGSETEPQSTLGESYIPNQSRWRSSMLPTMVSTLTKKSQKLWIRGQVRDDSDDESLYSNININNNCKYSNLENANNSSNVKPVEGRSEGIKNINLDSLHNQHTGDDKNKAIRRSITRLSPRAREAVDRYLENDNSALSPVFSHSDTSETRSLISPTVIEPPTERDTSQFYRLCTISDHEDDDNEASLSASPSSFTKHDTSVVGRDEFIHDTKAQSVLIHKGSCITRNSLEDKKEFKISETNTSGPECKLRTSTEKLLRDVKRLGMLIDNENSLYLETDINDELYLDSENFIGRRLDDNENDNKNNSANSRSIVTNSFCLSGKSEDFEDGGLSEGYSERDSLCNSMDEIKGNFLSLVKIQSHKARCNNGSTGESDGKEDKEQCTKNNQIHPVNPSNQGDPENGADDTPSSAEAPKWNIYDKFPSIFYIRDDASDDDDDDDNDYEYPLEGGRVLNVFRFRLFVLCFHC